MFSNIRIRTIAFSSYLTNRSPTIQFRYGPSREQKTTSGPPASGTSSKLTTENAKQSGRSQAIFDYQLPERFKRRPMSDEEIAYINRGGPE